jgi:nucleoside-diphosphate-sugar epimerase
MRVLVVGGSGYVGGLVTPILRQHHGLRIFDPLPPAVEADHVPGDATDYPALLAAMGGVDAVVHSAMGPAEGSETELAGVSFDVNVKSVYLTLLAANHGGVPHVVYLSSLSVYRDPTARRLDESTPPDAGDLYGLTKRLGEQVCQAATGQYGLSVNVLRLAWPTSDEAWPAWAKIQPPIRLSTPDGTPVQATAASDLAAAVLAALEFRDGFQIFNISGSRLWSLDKARALLGWSPTFGLPGSDAEGVGSVHAQHGGTDIGGYRATGGE